MESSHRRFSCLHQFPHPNNLKDIGHEKCGLVSNINTNCLHLITLTIIGILWQSIRSQCVNIQCPTAACETNIHNLSQQSISALMLLYSSLPVVNITFCFGSSTRGFLFIMTFLAILPHLYIYSNLISPLLTPLSPLVVMVHIINEVAMCCNGDKFQSVEVLRTMETQVYGVTPPITCADDIMIVELIQIMRRQPKCLKWNMWLSGVQQPCPTNTKRIEK